MWEDKFIFKNGEVVKSLAETMDNFRYPLVLGMWLYTSAHYRFYNDQFKLSISLMSLCFIFTYFWVMEVFNNMICVTGHEIAGEVYAIGSEDCEGK
jgi:hypothetical protein